MHNQQQPRLQVIEGVILISTQMTSEFSTGSDLGRARWGFYISSLTTQEFRQALDASSGQGKDSCISWLVAHGQQFFPPNKILPV